MLMSKAKNITSVKEIRDRLNPIFQDKGLKLALLFGSAASGKMHKQSDIDLAFLFDREFYKKDSYRAFSVAQIMEVRGGI